MDTRLVSFSKKKKKWIVLLGLIEFSSYGAYKISHIPSVERKTKRILKLLGCLVSMAKMVSESASLITLILKDLKEFLTIDQVEIPNSLKQLQKIARSEEFSESDLSLSADSLKTKSKVGIVDYGKNIGRIGPKNNGWVNSISSTLAVLRNRKFVLDVIGKVAFEIVRSVVEFFLWKMSEGLNRSVDVVVERGYEVVRYVGAKSSVILIICLLFFLHILGNARVLLPA
ncbi:UNVERIFIED_CONTAM: protein PHLOEM PROTEIN 2-LIKE A10 [Sesamum calycinum]|uniref:Protein PHLOEM PROTEIN 2-LIKE A10 n=1 Tax=Sesamum calycinum TaxID=2727403 RepID=A0AAW2JUA5_9LAMI